METKKLWHRFLVYGITLLCTAVILLPIGILIKGSFQGGGISNYVDILTKYHIYTYFFNSLIISKSNSKILR